MADGDKILNAQLADTVEKLQRDLEASEVRCAAIQDRYNRLEVSFNDQRRRILEDVVEAFEKITDDTTVAESVREDVQAILARLRGR